MYCSSVDKAHTDLKVAARGTPSLATRRVMIILNIIQGIGIVESQECQELVSLVAVCKNTKISFPRSPPLTEHRKVEGSRLIVGTLLRLERDA